MKTSEDLSSARWHYRTVVIPANALAIMDAETDRLHAAGVGENVLPLGATVPDFALDDHRGQRFRLSEALREGPVVTIFYRGGWCPYCNLHLRGFERERAAIEAAGGRLLAVSPELPDNTLDTAEKNKLGFSVLSDTGNTLARAFGLVFELSPDLLSLYTEFGHGLLEANGASGAHELPMPGTFVIGVDRKVLFAHAEVDYTYRADPETVIAVLNQAAAQS